MYKNMGEYIYIPQPPCLDYILYKITMVAAMGAIDDINSCFVDLLCCPIIKGRHTKHTNYTSYKLVLYWQDCAGEL